MGAACTLGCTMKTSAAIDNNNFDFIVNLLDQR
jgi:hypothetical protein